MTFARVSGILFLVSIVWMFSGERMPAFADVVSSGAAMLCIMVLAVLHQNGVVTTRRARLAVAAFVWFVLGMVYLRFLSPPSDIGGAFMAGLGIFAMVAVASWMLVDGSLYAKRSEGRPEAPAA